MTFRASQHPTRFPLQTVAAIPNNGPYQGTSAYDPSAGLNSERGCRVYVRDDVVAPTAQQPQGSVVMDETSQCFAIDKNSTSELERLRNALNARDISRTRWINIVGFSASASKVVTQKFLGDHDCLELNDLDIQTIGGPTRGSADSDFFWVQSQIWTAGNRERLWNSLRATSLRVIVCLPKEKEAGTIITQFAAPLQVANEASLVVTNSLLDGHSYERHTLGCVWILSFAIIRLLSEQLDFAFSRLDPFDILENFDSVPKLAELPSIQRKANRLARLNRYISSLEEITDFIESVQEMTMSEHFIKMPTNSDETLLPFDNASIRARARHEKKRTQSKLCHQRRLCETFMQPFDNLIQMMISYSTAQITERLDRGRQVAEQLGKIGIVVAVITGFVAPLSLITGYYGMNVKEFTPEADLSLFDVWQIGTPIILVSVVGVTVLGLWILTGQKRLPTGTITG